MSQIVFLGVNSSLSERIYSDECESSLMVSDPAHNSFYTVELIQLEEREEKHCWLEGDFKFDNS